jgi:signal transduction histidine kinase
VISPVVATALATSLPFFDPALDDPAAPAVIMVAALFSLARYNDLRTALLGYAVNLAQLVFYTLGVQDGFDPTNVVFIGGMSASPFVAGRIVRRLAEQSAQLVAQQELVRREAVIAERHRIARDLHDVIAHSISAMVVQTAAAQDLVRVDVDRAEELLANVADAGRAALAETGRLLHVIRDDADELGLAPAPGLANLGSMVQHFRDSGLAVELSVDEPLPQLDPGADVSAYRVVQEVLTNALKHSPDRAVSLRLGVTDGRLVIASSNGSDGHAGSGSGLGLLGMRERLSLLGGDLRHGLSPEGRFTVTASLPVGATA